MLTIELMLPRRKLKILNKRYYQIIREGLNISEKLDLVNPLPFRNEGDVLFVHFIFQNEGDCIFLEIPEKKGKYENFLIDMGRGTNDTGETGIPPEETGGFNSLKFFLNHFVQTNDRKIHYAVISHWHQDHCNEFEKFLKNKQLSPPKVWIPKSYPIFNDTDDGCVEINDLIEFDFKRLEFAEEKQKLYDKNNVLIEVIGPTEAYIQKLAAEGRGIFVDSELQPIQPSDEDFKKTKHTLVITVQSGKQKNDLSLVLRLTFCKKKIALFPGDLEVDGWNNLVTDNPGSKEWISSMRSLIRCDLLKIPHHGSLKIPQNLPQAFYPLPQYASSTYHNVIGRKFDEFGRQIFKVKDNKGKIKTIINPIENLVHIPGNNDEHRIEEVYHLGDSTDFIYRKLCTFAFKPNKSMDEVEIIPIIYKQDTEENPPKMYYFIRPSDKDSK